MVPTARVNQTYNSAKVQYHWVFCRRDPTSDSGYGRVSSMNRPFVLLLLALPAFAWTTSAKASWMDWYDKPNSGYCETAHPGLPLGNYFAQDARLCPENLKRSGNVLRQKPKRTSKPKSGRDVTPVDRYCFLSFRGICTCC
jgi:hypothetical protein